MVSRRRGQGLVLTVRDREWTAVSRRRGQGLVLTVRDREWTVVSRSRGPRAGAHRNGPPSTVTETFSGNRVSV